MVEKKVRKILKLRNDASTAIDDLLDIVKNNVLASDLRIFSAEIMGLTPGFYFSLKMAKRLRKMVRRALRMYRMGRMTDSDLVSFMVSARDTMKGEKKVKGGIGMVIKNLLGGKERKRQESMVELERSYQEICRKIIQCEETRINCVEQSRGHAPDSIIYRENERKYNAAENELQLLRSNERKLAQALETAGRMKLIEDYQKQAKAFSDRISAVLGSQKDQDRMIASIEVMDEKIESTLFKSENYGQEIFDRAASAATTANTSSAFGAAVAESERRQVMLETEIKNVNPTVKENHQSEFDRLVNDRNKSEEPAKGE